MQEILSSDVVILCYYVQLSVQQEGDAAPTWRNEPGAHSGRWRATVTKRAKNKSGKLESFLGKM